MFSGKIDSPRRRTACAKFLYEIMAPDLVVIRIHNHLQALGLLNARIAEGPILETNLYVPFLSRSWGTLHMVTYVYTYEIYA